MVKMNKKQIGVRFSEQTTNLIEKYPTRNETAFTHKLETIVEHMNKQIGIAKYELRGYLTLSEAWYILDITNSFLYTGEDPKSCLLSSIQDADLYEQTGSKWEVNITEFLQKIKDLSSFQCHVLYLMAEEFWSLPDEHRNGNQTEDIVKRIFCI
jgi:hypothetical protein